MAKNVCPRCGRELPEGACFCLSCGEERYSRRAVPTRIFPFRWFFSVCAGLLALSLAVALPLLRRSPQSEAHTEIPARTEAAVTDERGTEPEYETLTDPGETVENATEATSSVSGSSDKEPASTGVPTTEHVHTSAWTVTRASTCTEEGERKLICSACGAVEKTEAVPRHSTADGKCAWCGLYCYQGRSVKLINDLKTVAGNYFLCKTPGTYQDFYITSCRFYTAGGVLRCSGKARPEEPPAHADTCRVQIFFTGQNQMTAPLTDRAVTVIAAGASGTVDFDVPVANWSELLKLDYPSFEVYFANNV